MSGTNRVLCIIPARGGSKGVPKKNLRLLAGQPLLVHTLKHAQGAACIERIVVSTDDAEIAAVARAHGAGVIQRPPELSTDDASSESAIAHTLDELARSDAYVPHAVVFLQCTSAFRRRDDIDQAAAPVLAGEADSALAVVPFHGLLWRRERGQSRPQNFDPAHRPRRQEVANQYVENGSIYVFTHELFRRTGVRLGGRIHLHVMPAEAALDIDTELDFRVAEALVAAGLKEWLGQ